MTRLGSTRAKSPTRSHSPRLRKLSISSTVISRKRSSSLAMRDSVSARVSIARSSS